MTYMYISFIHVDPLLAFQAVLQEQVDVQGTVSTERSQGDTSHQVCRGGGS